MTKKKWIETGKGNVVLEADWGRVSYNSNTAQSVLCPEITELVKGFGKDVEDGEETALYCNGDFKILTGDFRKEYEEAFPDLEECLKVYDKYKDQHRNNWSTD